MMPSCTIPSTPGLSLIGLSLLRFERGFFESIDSDLFSGPQWEDLFWVNEPVYRELVCEFFAIFSFGDSTSINNPRVAGIQFRLGGGQRSFSLVEFGWRVGLYSKTEGDEIGTELALRNAMMARRDSTQRITLMDLFFMFSIYSERVL
ncbi:hypothetical protein Tco_0716927 [Tanacetum coccineum]